MEFDPTKRVEGHEVDLDTLLAETIAAEAATGLDEDEEFEAAVKGEIYLGALSARVKEPDREQVNYSERDEISALEESFDDQLFCATSGLTPPAEPTPAARAVGEFMKSATYRNIRDGAIAACAPGCCKCGEGTAKVVENEQHTWRMEYDSSGNLLRGYALNP